MRRQSDLQEFFEHENQSFLLVFTKWFVEYCVKSQLMPILEAGKVICQTVLLTAPH